MNNLLEDSLGDDKQGERVKKELEEARKEVGKRDTVIREMKKEKDEEIGKVKDRLRQLEKDFKERTLLLKDQECML